MFCANYELGCIDNEQASVNGVIMWYGVCMTRRIFISLHLHQRNAGGGIDISLNIRNKRADKNIILTCLSGLYFFLHSTLYSKGLHLIVKSSISPF